MSEPIDTQAPPISTDGPEFVPPLSQQEFYASLEDFDAINDLPTWKGLETITAPAPAVTLEAFSPDDRQALEARATEINPYNREAAISQAISEKLGQAAINLRVRSTSDEASHYVREHCAIEFELMQAEQESFKIADQLNARRTVTDPVSGKQIETDEFMVSGMQRDQLGKQLMDLFLRSEAMASGEGQRRRDAAREKDWAEYVDLQRRTWEAQEIDRRAKKMVVDDRLNTAAATRAKHLKVAN